jgi:uncharacterized lipoprotein YddW (UPF0748 family)
MKEGFRKRGVASPLFAAACLSLVLSGAARAQNEPPPFPREARAVWVATVSNIDWPTSRTLSTATQQAQIRTILDRAVELKLNAILLQVRPQCDAAYHSGLEPFTEYITNVMGNLPNPNYDPLAYWVQQAHQRGLELHAWFNPYRARHTSGTSPAHPLHVTRSKPHIVRDYGNYKWLDPGHPESPQHSRAVIADVVSRYDIDGVVFDDYFYPYPISGVPFPDDATYNAYLAGGGTLSRPDWRRKNVNDFIQSVYTTIKGMKPWVKFGLGPFGIWRPNNPPGITGLDAYASIYADSKKWINQGWCDYFSPQLYWRISSTGQPYEPLLQWWVGQNTMGRHIWPSNFTSNIGSQYGDWPVWEIQQQIDITRSTPGATGNVHFSQRAFTGNWKGINDALKANQYRNPAIIPASPWLDGTPPEKPRLKAYVSRTGTAFAWEEIVEPAWLWTVYTRYGNVWSYRVLPGLQSSIGIPYQTADGTLSGFAVGQVDRCGNESPRATFFP